MLIKFNNHLMNYCRDYNDYEIVKISICRSNQLKDIIHIDFSIGSIEIKLLINNLQLFIYSGYSYSISDNVFYIATPAFSNGDEFINLKELGKYNNFRKFINGFINVN